MLGRLQHFRGAYLLMISSALSFWVISFWWPLGDYLKALNSTKYADYKTYILVMVGVYLCFALINLIVAGLYATRISANLKLLLAVIPASILFDSDFAKISKSELFRGISSALSPLPIYQTNNFRCRHHNLGGHFGFELFSCCYGETGRIG
ncbi:MAG: hypothetical protein EBT82_03610 [Micrococcales bacterium]|nr:hypothetical protein [Micrococcales bacterium]